MHSLIFCWVIGLAILIVVSVNVRFERIVIRKRAHASWNTTWEIEICGILMDHKMSCESLQGPR